MGRTRVVVGPRRVARQGSQGFGEGREGESTAAEVKAPSDKGATGRRLLAGHELAHQPALPVAGLARDEDHGWLALSRTA